VVTGSQVPLSKPRSDALRNFVSSVAVAANGSNEGLEEVAVVFSNRIFRGCRVTKVDADDFCGFDTPNYPYLGDNALSIEFDRSAMFKLPIGRPEYRLSTPDDFGIRRRHFKYAIDTELDKFSVIVLHIYPGIDVSTVQNMILNTTPPVKGIVVRSYGAGNVQDNISKVSSAPGDAEGPLYTAFSRGILIVNTTQVIAGRVSVGTYAVSANMAKISVSGRGMTTEAAVTKLVTIFATPRLYDNNPPDWSTNPIEFREFAGKILSTNIVGEIGLPDTPPGGKAN